MRGLLFLLACANAGYSVTSYYLAANCTTNPPNQAIYTPTTGTCTPSACSATPDSFGRWSAVTCSANFVTLGIDKYTFDNVNCFNNATLIETYPKNVCVRGTFGTTGYLYDCTASDHTITVNGYSTLQCTGPVSQLRNYGYGACRVDTGTRWFGTGCEFFTTGTGTGTTTTPASAAAATGGCVLLLALALVLLY